MKSKRGLRISLENRLESLSEAVDVPVEPVDAVEDFDLVPSGDVKLATDVVKAQADANEAVDALDKLASVTEQLETVRENIAATLPNGGLTPAEAGAYAVATDAIVADLGVQQVIPAMESFGTSLSRVRATQVSMEALDGVLGRVAKRIGEVLAALFERIAKAVVRLVRRFTSDVSRAKKVAERLKKVSSTEASNRSTIKVYNSDAAYVTSDGGFAARNVIANLDAFESLLVDILPKRITPVAQARDINNYSIIRDVKFTSPFKLEETLPVGDQKLDSYSVLLVGPETKSGKTEIMVSVNDILPVVNRTITLLEASKIESVGRLINDTQRKIKTVLNDLGKKEGADEAATAASKQKLSDIQTLLTAYGSLAASAVGQYASLVSAILDVGSTVSKVKAPQPLKNAPAVVS